MLEYLLNVVGIKADEKDDEGRTVLQYAMEKAGPNSDRDPQAFESWERALSMLSELQERERPPYLPKPVL